MSKKHNQMRRALNYFEHFYVFVSSVSGFISITALASLIVIPVSIMNTAVGLKICAIAATITKYK